MRPFAQGSALALLLVLFSHVACALRTHQPSDEADGPSGCSSQAEPDGAEIEKLEGELAEAGPGELEKLSPLAELNFTDFENLEGDYEPPDPEELKSLQAYGYVGISGKVNWTANPKECDHQATLRWLGYDHGNDTEGPADSPPEPQKTKLGHNNLQEPFLNGSQWCQNPRGHTLNKTSVLNGRVALVLTGEAFRARNFNVRRKYDCSKPSVAVQRQVANNHLRYIVLPIEHDLHKKVDVYLTITGCMYEDRKGHSEEVKPDFNSTQKLIDFYNFGGYKGRPRVKGLLTNFTSGQGEFMYDHLADMHIKLDEAMALAKSGVYEYFIMIRYDVVLDRQFSDLIPNPDSAAASGRPLTFFASAHDFAWSFPGEMWNCMREWWNVCMRETSIKGLNSMDWSEREDLGCFKLGPLSLPRWAQGYGFDYALKAIGSAAQWPGGQPAVKLGKTGCSGFNAQGDELRCRSELYWPPRSQWEKRFMPYYFHIG